MQASSAATSMSKPCNCMNLDTIIISRYAFSSMVGFPMSKFDFKKYDKLYNISVYSSTLAPV